MLENMRCPKCGSARLSHSDYDDLFQFNGMLTLVFDCLKCNNRWTEEYRGPKPNEKCKNCGNADLDRLPATRVPSDMVHIEFNCSKCNTGWINIYKRSYHINKVTRDIPFCTFFEGTYGEFEGTFYMCADGYIIHLGRAVCVGTRYTGGEVLDYKEVNGPKLLSSRISSRRVLDIADGTCFTGSANGMSDFTFLKTHKVLLGFREAEAGCKAANTWTWNSREWVDMVIDDYCEVTLNAL